jgi:GxxExxY protein
MKTHSKIPIIDLSHGYQRREDLLTEKVIGIAMKIHTFFGPGLLESCYEGALCYELAQEGISFERQKEIFCVYKGVDLGIAYRADIILENIVVIELKSCERNHPVFCRQLLSYLKLANISVGLLINFNVPRLIDGIQRIVNKY